MERERPFHGGYPGGPVAEPRPVPKSITTLLEILPADEWYAIESAARADDETLAEFYRSKAAYSFRD